MAYQAIIVNMLRKQGQEKALYGYMERYNHGYAQIFLPLLPLCMVVGPQTSRMAAHLYCGWTRTSGSSATFFGSHRDHPPPHSSVPPLPPYFSNWGLGPGLANQNPPILPLFLVPLPPLFLFPLPLLLLLAGIHPHPRPYQLRSCGAKCVHHTLTSLMNLPMSPLRGHMWPSLPAQSPASFTLSPFACSPYGPFLHFPPSYHLQASLSLPWATAPLLHPLCPSAVLAFPRASSTQPFRPHLSIQATHVTCELHFLTEGLVHSCQALHFHSTSELFQPLPYHSPLPRPPSARPATRPDSASGCTPPTVLR